MGGTGRTQRAARPSYQQGSMAHRAALRPLGPSGKQWQQGIWGTRARDRQSRTLSYYDKGFG